jgi:hypothetical protein
MFECNEAPPRQGVAADKSNVGAIKPWAHLGFSVPKAMQLSQSGYRVLVNFLVSLAIKVFVAR